MIQLNILHITSLFIYSFLLGRQNLKLMEFVFSQVNAMQTPNMEKYHSAFVQCAQIMQCSPTLLFSIKQTDDLSFYTP